MITRRSFFRLTTALLARILLSVGETPAVQAGRYNETGHAIFIFADGHASTMYAYQRLEGWPGMALINPSTIGLPEHLHVLHCDVLNSAGWDVSSHGYTHEDPTLMTPEELEDHLKLAHQWLLSRGYTNGAKHYGPPLACDQAVRDAALQYHDTVIPAKLGQWAVLPEGLDYIWRSTSNIVKWPAIQSGLEWAAQGANRVIVLVSHKIAETGQPHLTTSIRRLQRIINLARSLRINVVSMSQLMGKFSDI